eukprot:scaffold67237_cov66-Phaeocystis_antarctica.AAC.2
MILLLNEREVALFVARAPRWHRLCAMITRLELVAAPEFEMRRVPLAPCGSTSYIVKHAKIRVARPRAIQRWRSTSLRQSSRGGQQLARRCMCPQPRLQRIPLSKRFSSLRDVRFQRSEFIRAYARQTDGDSTTSGLASHGMNIKLFGARAREARIIKKTPRCSRLLQSADSRLVLPSRHVYNVLIKAFYHQKRRFNDGRLHYPPKLAVRGCVASLIALQPSCCRFMTCGEFRLLRFFGDVTSIDAREPTHIQAK